MKSGNKHKWWNRELTLKCKIILVLCETHAGKTRWVLALVEGITLGTTRGKEKRFLTSVGIEPTTSGLALQLLCRLSYEVGQRKTRRFKVVNRGEEKVRYISMLCRLAL